MKDKLLKLGLSEKEALVYLTLLRIGPSVASTLARLTGIKRTSMYDLMNSLIERNLIMTFRQGTYTYYVVDDVNKLYLYEKEKADFAKKLVEELKENKASAGIQVNYYKGLEGYREIYEDILRVNPKEFFGWIHLDYFYKALDMKREMQWTKERIQKKIHVRLIMEDTPIAKKYKKEDPLSYRETRLTSGGEKYKTTCLLYEDYITFFDPTDEISGIRIKNPELFKMQKTIFEMNWIQLAKKVGR